MVTGPAPGGVRSCGKTAAGSDPAAGQVSDATALGPAAAVMGQGGDIADQGDLQAGDLQGYLYQHAEVLGQQAIVDQRLKLAEGTRLQQLAPIVQQKKGEFQDLFASLQSQGYARAVVDGETVVLSEAKPLKKSFLKLPGCKK